jgi:FMN phosphatase YigB (HAD superfamily)
MSVTVLFDAFGTLLKISKGVHPYRQLLKEGMRQGRRPQPDDLLVLMTQPLGLQQAADFFKIQISPAHLDDLQHALDLELARIEPFEDGLHAVELLQCEGVRVAVCSNLAMPYGDPVKRLYPNLDGYGLSFEIGAMKPDRSIYHETCALVGAELTMFSGLDLTLMIGDSPKCDRDGPRAAGIRGFLLSRSGNGDFESLAEFAQTVLQEIQVA